MSPASTPITPEHQQALEANPWFAELDQPLRSAITQAGNVVAISDGTTLFRRGQAPDAWYCVLSGAIRISGTSAAGKESILSYIEPGGWFGEISLFDKLPRSHDGTAHGASELLVVPAPQFYAIVDRFPQLSHAIIRHLAARMRYLFGLIEDLSTLPLPQRLAKQLLAMAEYYGVEENGTIRIKLQIAQEQIAQMLGASRQRVNIEMKQLQKHALVAQKNGFLVILDKPALEKFVLRS
jgi:CRP/FNR family transcriptional regulator, cyclic AMP receptor protein